MNGRGRGRRSRWNVPGDERAATTQEPMVGKAERSSTSPPKDLGRLCWKHTRALLADVSHDTHILNLGPKTHEQSRSPSPIPHSSRGRSRNFFGHMWPVAGPPEIIIITSSHRESWLRYDMNGWGIPWRLEGRRGAFEGDGEQMLEAGRG